MIPVYTRYISPTNYGASDLIEILSAIVMITISMAADTMSRFYYAELQPTARNKVVSTVIVGFSILGIPVVLLFLLLASSPWVGNILLEDLEYRRYLQIGIATIWFSMLCDFGYSYLRMIYRAKLFVMLSIIQLLINLALNIYFIVFLDGTS